jgi:hypothetical protein
MLLILPGEGLSMWVGTACGALSPNKSRNARVMHRESADEVIVVVKHLTEEGTATYWRMLADESARKAEMKGGTC